MFGAKRIETYVPRQAENVAALSRAKNVAQFGNRNTFLAIFIWDILWQSNPHSAATFYDFYFKLLIEIIYYFKFLKSSNFISWAAFSPAKNRLFSNLVICPSQVSSWANIFQYHHFCIQHSECFSKQFHKRHEKLSM